MEPNNQKNPNLTTTMASIAMDAAKLITGVPLDYPDALLFPNLRRKTALWMT